MVRLSDTDLKRSPPPTAEELERARVGIETIRRLHAELLSARGGRLFPESADDLTELRAEREADLP